MTGLDPPRPAGPLPELGPRFAARLKEDGTLTPGGRVVVALSGGLDSTVLLHLLRFTPDLPDLHLCAAHFDHLMRPGSGVDRSWVAGLCRAWDIPLRSGAAASPPTTEEEARRARYGFLLGVKAREGADWVLTGHHGDDQAETILFRILRGTGLRGLSGIPGTRDPGLYRPLLPFFREDLLGYARSRGIRFLQDPTNLDLRYSRNFLRHRILPQLRDGPIPGARESLLRIGRLARDEEAAWASLLPGLLEGVFEEEEAGTFIVRSGLLVYHPAVRARLLREAFKRAGLELDETGTRRAVEFTRSGESGRSVTLPGGLRLIREFDRFRLLAGGGEGGGEGETGSLSIQDPTPGAATLRVAGSLFRVAWGPAPSDELLRWTKLPLSGVDLPLVVRGWEPGDRILLPYGTKKLKKLFAEEKIPAEARGRIPVLVDAGGRVLWVPGVASSVLITDPGGDGAFFLGIGNADEYGLFDQTVGS